MVPTQWPLAKVVKVLKTHNGTYTRLVTKVTLLLPREQKVNHTNN